MDALQALYDSQVSEDDAVAVLHFSQQYDEAVDLDESEFRVVNIAAIDIQADHDAPRQIEEIVPAEEREAPRQPADELEAPRQIAEIVPAEEIVPDEERNTRRSRSRSAGRPCRSLRPPARRRQPANSHSRPASPVQIGPGRPAAEGHLRPAPRRARHFDPPVRT